MASIDYIYLPAMAKLLDRAEHTVRQWVAEKDRDPGRDGSLPDDLVPERIGGRRVIAWLPSQLDGLKDYAAERATRRGWQRGQR